MTQLLQPYGYIYKITNLQNNKIYIGQTTQLNKRYFCGGKIIKQAIKKYGKQFFKREILGFCYSQEELNLAEKECISFFNSRNNIYGYNLRDGGRDGIFDEETKLKMSKAKIGNKNALGHKGVKVILTPEQHKKMIENRKTNRALLEQNGIYRTWKYSDETKLKMKGRNKGKEPWNKGLTNVYSEETKKNMSISARNRRCK